MLGHFTERATSRGRSRSFGHHGHNSISSNESAQRRALLLPQEFKELGPERIVVIAENCKPILGEKIRYHRDKAFKARLRPPPEVPVMKMDLHLARVQQRWVYAPDEVDVNAKLDIESLANDFPMPPEPAVLMTPAQATNYADAFLERTKVETSPGGSIEPATDFDLDRLDQRATEALMP